MSNEVMRVLVLRGGPGREHEVSLKSGAQVAKALREAGHEVRESDVGPGSLDVLDEFVGWDGVGGDVVFPVLHGKWGEGGSMQRVLEERGLAYVGAEEGAAALCMDKHRTKVMLSEAGIDTPGSELIGRGEKPTLNVPAVVKIPDEGSSIGLRICHQPEQLDEAVAALHEIAPVLLIEQFIAGPELTVGVVDGLGSDGHAGDDEPTALPPIHIVPATSYYDFNAKYDRDDTQYRFELPGPSGLGERLQDIARRVHGVLGCRDLSRVDFMVDEDGRAWCLEVNTMPGFTDHSLLPMAARRAGYAMPALTSHLVNRAMQRKGG